MKNGCGKSVTKGHGEVAVCGKDYYEEIYTCDSCLKLRVAELEAVLRECREVLLRCEDAFDDGIDMTVEAIAKIDEVLHRDP